MAGRGSARGKRWVSIHVVQGGDTNVVPDRRPPHNRRDPTRSGGAHFSLSQDHLGEEPLNLRPGPTPTSRDLCRFCLSWPGHTNRRQPSLSAVIAGIRQGRGNGQGLSGQIASPRLAKGGGEFTALRHGGHASPMPSLIQLCIYSDKFATGSGRRWSESWEVEGIRLQL